MLVRLANTGRDAIAFKADGERHVLVNHPDYVKQVLMRTDRYSKDTPPNRFFKEEVADGLLTAEGTSWVHQRKLLAPAFKAVAQMRSVAQVCADEMIARLETIADTDQAVNLTAAISEFTLAVTTRLLFGFRHESFSDQCESIGTLLSNANSVRPGSHRPIQELREKLYTTIRNAKRERPSEAFPGLAWGELCKDEALSETALTEQIATLLLAGFETTANSLTWAWIELIRHPEEYSEWQRALDDELDTPFTDVLFKETLRLYPPAWIIGRRALVNDRVGGLTLAPGTVVAISPYLLQRHPRYWERPDEFVIDRFAAGRGRPIHRYAYLPFGAGARVCIGQVLALHEASVLLSALGARFRFSAAETTDASPDHKFVLRAPETFLVKVRDRASGQMFRREQLQHQISE
ncbi:hypothetical protein A9W96_27370 [Mycobacterium sp. 1245852.3]|nr:hypothetical protein A9W96_27370 [Mycobacterium sp. 1245852.3]